MMQGFQLSLGLPADSLPSVYHGTGRICEACMDGDDWIYACYDRAFTCLCCGSQLPIEDFVGDGVVLPAPVRTVRPMRGSSSYPYGVPFE